MKRIGTKLQVYRGTALRTSGGLHKQDLMLSSKGRIVSIKQHKNGIEALKRLHALGYVAKKGEFSLFRKQSPQSDNKSPE
jgi:hypothetical protein